MNGSLPYPDYTRATQRWRTAPPRADAFLLFCFALAWRLLYLHDLLSHSPFFESPVGDAQLLIEEQAYEQAHIDLVRLYRKLGDELSARQTLGKLHSLRRGGETQYIRRSAEEDLRGLIR